MDMIAILQSFIRAERTGDWLMHLAVLRDMLPFLAASGHNHYTKSLHLYLQNMDYLEQKHPIVYQYFMKGYHVIRRSDRFWGGLSLDLIIEQVLMRSLKTTGGLTRGGGMGEIQRLIWILSSGVRTELNLAMQELYGICYETNKQDKDTSQTRMAMDITDTQKLLDFLSLRNPLKTTLNCIVWLLGSLQMNL